LGVKKKILTTPLIFWKTIVIIFTCGPQTGIAKKPESLKKIGSTHFKIFNIFCDISMPEHVVYKSDNTESMYNTRSHCTQKQNVVNRFHNMLSCTKQITIFKNGLLTPYHAYSTNFINAPQYQWIVLLITHSHGSARVF